MFLAGPTPNAAHIVIFRRFVSRPGFDSCNAEKADSESADLKTAREHFHAEEYAEEVVPGHNEINIGKPFERSRRSRRSRFETG